MNHHDAVQAALDEASANIGADLLDLATNYYGTLAHSIRGRIEALIEDPTVDTWDNAYSIIVNANRGLGLTMWQAVLAVDPNCPRAQTPYASRENADVRWGGYAPDAFTVIEALYEGLVND